MRGQHLTYVEQLEEDIIRLKTRLEHTDDPRLHRLVLDDIASLKTRRARKLLVYANTVVARGTPWLKISPAI